MLSRNSDQVYDLIVIGAGFSGIETARFYLEAHSKCRPLIVDKYEYPGGVWSKSHVYSGFWSQTGERMVGFSDRPFELPIDAPRIHIDLFEAKYMAEYFDEYMDSHSYEGQTLKDRTMFNFSVERVQKVKDLWTVSGVQNGANFDFRSTRLTVATGAFSRPYYPIMQGRDDFKGPVIHSKEFGQSNAQSDPSIKKIIVLGASKSAADYSWVIRKSGQGPGLFLDPAVPGPYRNSIEVAHVKLFSILFPSPWGSFSWWRHVLHSTNFGKRLTRGFMSAAMSVAMKAANYRNRPGARDGFQNLEPTLEVVVVREDVSCLDNRGMVLADGSSVATDAIVLATGFLDSHTYFDTEQKIQLGLPHLKSDGSSSEAALWKKLEDAAEPTILQCYPAFADPPKDIYVAPCRSSRTAFRLYKHITPIHDHSIAFPGEPQVANAFRNGELRGIWITALFDGALKLPTEEKMRESIAYANVFSRLNAPTAGLQGEWITPAGGMRYFEALLQEVDLKSHKKSWLLDLVTPYIMSDYKGLK
ncbi:FAD/NAD(P)-binding domain-containing protein [Eremomyces bilateralis CBS 781.70]|uniref:FAD/NAD(P)-binding domain-containing protein n=1 Tax=Eremomyces bilateralis CBS 781.70 TaxID=1392243 RepID=A0A6G1GC25_9PEZI|nr:FAD/NAD(P)-binding domain-containing protein [Eremomyces bilateralis CBS 781.70]KAF1815450.1 FAD/NAD(P)-binding domain-containing protein [Eremomyces bilateralis CBS 781.70]